MTCKEKLMELYPDYESAIKHIMEEGCPEDYMDIIEPDYCDPLNHDGLCARCWDRECPTYETVTFTINNVTPEDVADGPIIKDSGDRTRFESGAVRDMREGKGRCDLMPLEVVAEYFRRGIFEPDPKRAKDFYWIIRNISDFKDSNYAKTDYLYQALSVFMGRYYDYTPTAFLEVAKHFEEGAKKYGESNWQKGIPVHCYIDSAVRHFLKIARCDEDEPHDRAFVWNLMCCIWEVDYGEECRKHKETMNA